MTPSGTVGDRWREAPRRHRLVAVVGSVLVAAVGTAAVAGTLRDAVDPAALRAFLEGLGPYAPVVYVVLQAIQVVVAPIPGQLLAGVGGYLFGGIRATLLSMLGVAVGGLIVFTLARRVGRPRVERWLGEDHVSRFDQFGAENGAVTLFVLFLLPTFPDDLLCAVAGLWDLRARTFLVLLLVGRTPSFYAVAVAGQSLQSGALGRTSVVLGAVAAVVVLVYVVRDPIRERLRGEDPSVE